MCSMAAPRLTPKLVGDPSAGLHIVSRPFLLCLSHLLLLSPPASRRPPRGSGFGATSCVRMNIHYIVFLISGHRRMCCVAFLLHLCSAVWRLPIVCTKRIPTKIRVSGETKGEVRVCAKLNGIKPVCLSVPGLFQYPKVSWANTFSEPHKLNMWSLVGWPFLTS